MIHLFDKNTLGGWTWHHQPSVHNPEEDAVVVMVLVPTHLHSHVNHVGAVGMFHRQNRKKKI